MWVKEDRGRRVRVSAHGVGDVDKRQGIFFFQAEDGIRDLVRCRGLGDVYKRQDQLRAFGECLADGCFEIRHRLRIDQRTHQGPGLQLSLIHI